MPDLANARALLSPLPTLSPADLPAHLPGIVGPMERFDPGSEGLIINSRIASVVPAVAVPEHPPDFDASLWTSDERSFRAVLAATSRYADRDWRREDFPNKSEAAAFLRRGYPQLRGCALDLDQLCQLCAAFPSLADWQAHGFDPVRMWQVHQDPQRQAARRQAERARQRQLREDCQAFVEQTLTDSLLLAIRGGDWHAIQPLAELVRKLTPAHLAEQRYRAAAPSRGPAPGSPETRGVYLLLDDAVSLCRRRKLVEVRTAATGQPEVRSTPWKDDRFEVLPLFRDLLPRSPDEDARLEQLLRAEGCRDSLIVWQSRRLLVDGHTRYALCTLLGRKYRLEYREFADEQEVCRYIGELHYGRRSLNLLQKSVVRARAYLALRQAHGGDHTSAGAKWKNSPGRNTADRVAEEYQVDRKTIYNDIHLIQALDQILAHCGPELEAVILSGRIKGTRKSYLEKLARLPADEQRRLVQAAVAAGRWPALASAEGPDRVSVRLPLDQPETQARLLVDGLGRSAAVALIDALLQVVGEAPDEGRPSGGT